MSLRLKVSAFANVSNEMAEHLLSIAQTFNKEFSSHRRRAKVSLPPITSLPGLPFKTRIALQLLNQLLRKRASQRPSLLAALIRRFARANLWSFEDQIIPHKLPLPRRQLLKIRDGLFL
jgi:hypothetical protein